MYLCLLFLFSICTQKLAVSDGSINSHPERQKFESFQLKPLGHTFVKS